MKLQTFVQLFLVTGIFAIISCSNDTVSVLPAQTTPDENNIQDTSKVDTDTDGIFDTDDNCPKDVNKDQADLDEDKVGDVCDTDVDGDGKLNYEDNCSKVKNPDQADSNSNGLGDACEVSGKPDSDGDGIIDENDRCPSDRNKTEPGQCGCGISDTDTDADGQPDCVDNCPNVANQSQQDSDGDRIGDACDEVIEPPHNYDIDGDGIEDSIDNCPDAYNPDQESEACECNDNNAFVVEADNQTGEDESWKIQEAVSNYECVKLVGRFDIAQDIEINESITIFGDENTKLMNMANPEAFFPIFTIKIFSGINNQKIYIRGIEFTDSRQGTASALWFDISKGSGYNQIVLENLKIINLEGGLMIPISGTNNKLTLVNSQLTGNRSKYHYSAGAFIYATDSSIVNILYNIFENNICTYRDFGGCGLASGAADFSNVLIKGNDFRNNIVNAERESYGAGLYVFSNDEGSTLVEENRFISNQGNANSSYAYGGGIYAQTYNTAEIIIRDNKICSNVVSSDGGPEHGGGIYWDNLQGGIITFVNNIFPVENTPDNIFQAQ